MRKFLLSLIVSAATMSAPALAATECETLCQAEFYQTATADTIQELLDGGLVVSLKLAYGVLYQKIIFATDTDRQTSISRLLIK